MPGLRLCQPWRKAFRLLAGFVLCLAVGCLTPSRTQQLQQCLGSGCDQRYPCDPLVQQSYRLAPPDVVSVRIGQPPVWQGQAELHPDGNILLGPFGKVQAEGFTTTALAAVIADHTHLPLSRIDVWVTAYRSRQLVVFGPVQGMPRAMPYHGPETVVQFLQRLGGVQAGANLAKIHVLRPNVHLGQAPELFRVNVEQIILRRDSSTNIRLQPNDQLYIGETRRSVLQKLLPPWLQPLYEACCLLLPNPHALKRKP